MDKLWFINIADNCSAFKNEWTRVTFFNTNKCQELFSDRGKIITQKIVYFNVIYAYKGTKSYMKIIPINFMHIVVLGRKEEGKDRCLTVPIMLYLSK